MGMIITMLRRVQSQLTQEKSELEYCTLLLDWRQLFNEPFLQLENQIWFWPQTFSIRIGNSSLRISIATIRRLKFKLKSKSKYPDYETINDKYYHILTFFTTVSTETVMLLDTSDKLWVDLEFEIIIWGQLVTYYTRNYIYFPM